MPEDELVPMAIDDDLCIGVGQCELLEPEVFRLDDDEGRAHLINDGRLPRDRAETVVDKCPSGAISIRPTT